MPPTMRLFNLFFLLLSLTSCSREPLTVYTHYVTIEDLASYYVDTPDPFLKDPPFEEQLTIEWYLPAEECLDQPARLFYVIRLRNREEITNTITIERQSGKYLFRLPCDRYFETGGILTYKVQLLRGDQIIEEWRHPLWVELILLGTSS